MNLNFFNPNRKPDNIDKQESTEKTVSSHTDPIEAVKHDILDEIPNNEEQNEYETPQEPEQEYRQRLVPKTFDEGKEYTKLQGLSDNLQDKDFRRKSAEKSSEIIEADLEKEKQKIQLEILELEKRKLEISHNKEQVASSSFRTKYGSKLDRQEYTHRKLKPFMDFLDIIDPTAVSIMYLLTILIFPFFFVGKLIKAILINPIRSFFSIFRKQETRHYKTRLDGDR